MKFQIYKAIDKVDGGESLFMFDEIDGFTVIDYSTEGIGHLVENAHSHGCDWDDLDGGTPRRDDMINPVLICEVNV